MMKDRDIIFNNVIFRRDDWVECNNLGVKLPHIFLKPILEGKNWVYTDMDKKITAIKDATLQLIVRALLTAFNLASKAEDISEINEALLFVIDLISFDQLTSKRSEIIWMGIIYVVRIDQASVIGNNKS